MFEQISSSTERSWLVHIKALRALVQQRRTLQPVESYPYIIWWICQVDINALLSGSGDGEFIAFILQNNLLPTSRQLHECGSFLTAGSLFPPEWEMMCSALDFHWQILAHAASIGHLAKQMRAAAAQLLQPVTHAQTVLWRQQADRARDLLFQTWNSQMPVSIASGYQARSLPEAVQENFEHVS